MEPKEETAPQMDFQAALDCLKEGSSVMRDRWAGRIEIDSGKLMLSDPDAGLFAEWKPSSEDLLADDWRVLA